ncbi:MAG: type II toxin-antitoxin system RelE/ParE family toxin [Planctomycetota bacterium]
MIVSFKDEFTREVFQRTPPKGIPPDIVSRAIRKLRVLDAADALEDLATPPGNRLQPLKGDREGQHSIRVNDQWRICFVWTIVGPHEVELVDYH